MPHEGEHHPGSEVSRRGVLRGTAVAGVAVPFLAACGSGEEEPSADDPTGDAPNGDGGGTALASTGDVPVGQGTVLNDEEIVLTQPAEGEFKAFTAVCTHQGCIVASVSEGTINCDCHGSQFSAETGEATQGPATAPLEEVRIRVQGDQILRG